MHLDNDCAPLYPQYILKLISFRDGLGIKGASMQLTIGVTRVGNELDILSKNNPMVGFN